MGARGIDPRGLSEERLVYNMRPEGCQGSGARPRLSRKSFLRKNFLATRSLTLLKGGTYTDRVTLRRFRPMTAVALALALSTPVGLRAQALQRAVYVSALDQEGAPLTSLAPADI